MADRDHTSYLENTYIAFAMYCDGEGLTYEEGLRLSDDLAEVVALTANDRRSYAVIEEEDE